MHTISDRIAIQVNSHKALCPVPAIDNGQLSPTTGLIGWLAGRKLSQVFADASKIIEPLNGCAFF